MCDPVGRPRFEKRPCQQFAARGLVGRDGDGVGMITVALAAGQRSDRIAIAVIRALLVGDDDGGTEGRRSYGSGIDTTAPWL